MAKRGPKGPHKYTDAFLVELTEKLLEYIDVTPIPFIKEFAYQVHICSDHITRTCIVRSEEFADAVKRLKDKQEVSLIRETLNGKANPAMAIFCLKNVAGWRDMPNIVDTDERLKDEVDFVGVPSVEGNGRFKRFYN